MSRLHYITGAGGTGKTHALGDALEEWLDKNELKEHQYVLAMTRMHGSRRRLCQRLPSPSLRSKLIVTTVDSFALRLVNRWRLSLGYNSPIVPGEEGGFMKDELGYRAAFDEIMKSAADLSASPLVVKTVANAFPLILVDEFQDCTGSQLSLIANLKQYVNLILAGDPFQALDGDESACEWARGFEGQESFQLTRLQDCRRTECPHLLEAAHALLENRPATYSATPLPFFFAPRYHLAVYKVLFPRLEPHRTAALIYPAHRALANLKNSVESQNKRRPGEGKKPLSFPWRTLLSDSELVRQTHAGFIEAIRQETWNQNEKWREMYKQVQYLSKAKGHIKPPEKFFEYVVNSFVQARKFVGAQPIKFEATTVHGAKNREFNHVYVVWDNNLCANLGDERKRRLLYNAITRAQTSATVIAIGSETQVGECPVLSLLGKPASCFRT